MMILAAMAMLYAATCESDDTPNPLDAAYASRRSLAERFFYHLANPMLRWGRQSSDSYAHTESSRAPLVA